MAKDALDAVREAEDEARTLMAEAAQHAREEKREAETLAEAKAKEIMSQAQKEADLLKEKAKTLGDELAKPILEKGATQAQKLEALGREDLKDAVNIIVERIVKSNGNR
ncbi:ATPase [Proteiniclasticum sp. BAD-10]|uniref:ATPase n=1 Tax=Proteiniclasticum sediminis TaxID=2804028 RepID=A0A941CPF9_9CLOT|nr:ATPase [Proteiniclasticum sediminis]MBR0575822.1 ATPase [Proteiniclasticum sediminis]